MKYVMMDAETGKHHTGPDDHLRVHFPGTCEVNNVDASLSSHPPFDPRSSSSEIRLMPSCRGLVALCYETKGMITFYAQINAERAAWQRIKWHPDYLDHWDADEVQRAVDNFLEVAEQEANQGPLDQRD